MEANKKPVILVIDDTPANLALLANLLRETYEVCIANHGQKGLTLAFSDLPDLILLDVMMPDMDGWEVCRRLKSDPRTFRIPVIFLTAKASQEDEEFGLSLGAVDFITKPISPPIVLARIKTHLQNKAWQDFLQDQNDWLQVEVLRRLSEVNRLQDASIWVMVSLAEFRDECTGYHIRRTQEFVRMLAEHLALESSYAAQLTAHDIEQLAKSAPLHDIGKIAIPDHILLKPDKLSIEEFSIMKTHAERGFEMLKTAGSYMGEQGDFLLRSMEIARHHHEKWDGSGYPDGLAGTSIPLSARLMAVADVYDALITKRPYKKPFTHEAALQFIEGNSGSHFEPRMVQALVALQSRFIEISKQWVDGV